MFHRNRLVAGLVVLGLTWAGGARAQNAVINGDFATSLTGWTTSPAECSFNAGEGRIAPGAAQCTVTLEVGVTVIAMRQCLPATAGVAYDFGGSIRLASSPHPTARGIVGVTWFDTADCSGPPSLGSPKTASVYGTAW